MKFTTPGDRAASNTGQKYCEKHSKYYGGRGKYKVCPDCEKIKHINKVVSF